MDQSTISGLSISESTGEKPQSKVWEYDGQWWSVLPNDSGTSLWRLNSGSWNQVLQLSSNNGTQADVKVVGSLAHVLMFQGSTSELVTLEYGAGSGGGYGFWSIQPNVVEVPLGSSVEMATLDVDTTGRMWLAYDRSSTVEVRYSDGAYTSFSAPITVASGISSDDISSVIAMPGGKIGVFWSNQNSKRFGFKTHVDGASEVIWSPDESPASQSAQSTGGGFADDHVHLATSANGTLYAAIKTSYDTGSTPTIMLLVRRPNGAWDNAYNVANSGTRPIVVVSDVHNELAVIYTDATGGGDIVLRGSALDTIQFGPTQTLISGNLDDVTSSKGAVGNEIVVLATRGSTAEGRLIRLGTPDGGTPDNNAPTVNAGADQIVILPGTANLSGTASDDGQPSGTLTTTWSKVSGPGTVSFGNANALSTSATFSQAGSYVLQLAATDGSLQASDQVVVDVQAPKDQSGSSPVAVSFQNGVNGYQGTRDTMLQSSSQSATSGGATSLNVDGSPDASVLIAWDLSTIPTGSVVQSASIALQVTNTSNATYPIYAVNRAWNESQATWMLASQGVNWSSAGAQGSADRGATAIGQLSASSTGQATVTLNATGIALVQSWINTPGSNFGIIIQNYSSSASNGADFNSREASSVSTRPKLTVTYQGSGTVTNQPPQANAGADQTIALPSGATLSGAVTDDGLPPPGMLTSTWSKMSGPGTVSFGNANALSTTASFSQAGTYVLQLTASDGSLQGSDQLTIQVNSQPSQNTAPVVNGGADQSITLPSGASLSGTASDDGQPSGTLTTTWSKVSGPGTVSFGNANTLSTSATFSQAGSYVLRLTGSDGSLQGTDDVSIQVAAAPSSNPVTVSFQNGLNGYQGTRDTMLQSSSQSATSGSATSLNVDGSPDASVLIAWDLSTIPAGSVIQSASIALQVTNTSNVSYPIYAVNRAWSESQATWILASQGVNWSSAGAQGSADRSATAIGQLSASSTGQATVTLNATGIALVQSWINTPGANFGIIIQNYSSSASNGADFNSREASSISTRPKFTVTYAPGG